jgi:hypothetical protein
MIFRLGSKGKDTGLKVIQTICLVFEMFIRRKQRNTRGVMTKLLSVYVA